jgi:hypothetical protein
MMSTHVRVLTVAFVALWALAGPIGMAFDGCVMGAMCEGPCGLTSIVVSIAPTAVLVLSVHGEVPPVVQAHATGVKQVLEPPPRAPLHLA